MEFTSDRTYLEFVHNGERVRVEPWGENSFRVRATMQHTFTPENWALTEPVPVLNPPVETASVPAPSEAEERPMEIAGTITNGILRCEVSAVGQLFFRHLEKDMYLLEEFSRAPGDRGLHAACLRVRSRTWKSIPGSDLYSLCLRFEAPRDDHVYGMGQYQQADLDLRGCVLELSQRNSQISVPFAVSSRGFGFLWNNPAVGEAFFGNNVYQWTARATPQMDYWITAADTPAGILKNYTAVTGRPGTFPGELLGLWQSKLRYRTQKEVLDVARQYLSEGIRLSTIVIDFFHWTYQGDWKFDPEYWPDPRAMVEELHSMGIRVLVSVWPSVDRRSGNFETLKDRGLLIRTERGSGQTYNFQGDCSEIDAFNEEAVRFIWDRCRESYYDIGFDGFWLDNCEPDLVEYDFDHFRYCAGPALSVTNAYPQELSRGFYERMREADPDVPVVNLVRSCWAGSQKYGNVVWSGDVPSTFEALRDQISAGLNMGMAGIPWWTTDTGGFLTRDSSDPEFRELLIRWFQFSVFSPVLRLHGNRGPWDTAPLDDRDWGGGYLFTGQPNEIWSFGKEVKEILTHYLEVRRGLAGELGKLFSEAAETGAPIMRSMFYEFPDDPVCLEVQGQQYMLGSSLLVAPVTEYRARMRTLYLPAGTWHLSGSGDVYEGPGMYSVDAPLSYMPVFARAGTPAL